MPKPNTSPEVVTKRILDYLRSLGLATTEVVEAEIAARIAGHENVAEEKTRKELASVYSVYALNLNDVTAEYCVTLKETLKRRVAWVTESLEAARSYAEKQAKETRKPFVVVNGAFEFLEVFDEENNRDTGYTLHTSVGTVENYDATTMEDIKAEDFHLVDAAFFTKLYAVASAKKYVQKIRQTSSKNWEQSLIFVTFGNEREVLWSMQY